MTEENLTQLKDQVYKDPRPAEHFDRFHARSRTTDPNWVYEAVRIATTLHAWTFFRGKVRFMAKSLLFKPPMEWFFSPGGVFPVRRGYADEEAFITARSILDRGGVIA